MTLDDLRLFVAACEAGSLSAVGARFGTSQSAVSQHVRRLERELDVTLLERGRRGVTPTAAGRILLTAAGDALGALDAGRRELERHRNGASGCLRVTTGGTTLRHFMTRPLAEFRARHPAVTFDYVSAVSTTQCLRALRADDADVAFVTLVGDHGPEQRPTLRTRWVLLVPADDPMAGRAALDPTDLRTLPLIAMPAHATSRGELESTLVRHGVRLHISTTVDDWDTAIQLVALGVGRSVVPALWIHDLADRPELRALPITGLPPLTFGWVARRWDALPRYAKDFVALVDDGFTRLEPAALAEVLPADPASPGRRTDGR
jgi:DNA-binding transcriptional LysR family regulator